MKDRKPKTDPKEKFLGMPMRWERQKMFKNIWNKSDDRIFPQKYFGIGWDLNFHALLKKTGFIKANSKSDKSFHTM